MSLYKYLLCALIFFVNITSFGQTTIVNYDRLVIDNEVYEYDIIAYFSIYQKKSNSHLTLVIDNEARAYFAKEKAKLIEKEEKTFIVNEYYSPDLENYFLVSVETNLKSILIKGLNLDGSERKEDNMILFKSND